MKITGQGYSDGDDDDDDDNDNDDDDDVRVLRDYSKAQLTSTSY